jgi:hypothetical protein
VKLISVKFSSVGGRINGVEILARFRRDKFSVDEQLVAVAKFDVAVRFRRGRVTPAFTEIQGPMSFCNRRFSTLTVSIKDGELGWLAPRHKLR